MPCAGCGGIGHNRTTCGRERAKALPETVPADALGIAVDAVNRDQRRSRRKREVRARTINVRRLTKRELEMGRVLYPDVPHWRPSTRGECAMVTRPCPFVSCRHHLFIDVNEKNGAIKMNFPDLEVDELGVSCALDAADRGGLPLEEAGAILNLTRERIRQVEEKALIRLKVLMPQDEDETRYATRVHHRAPAPPPPVEFDEDPSEALEGGVGVKLPDDVARWLEGAE